MKWDGKRGSGKKISGKRVGWGEKERCDEMRVYWSICDRGESLLEERGC